VRRRSDFPAPVLPRQLFLHVDSPFSLRRRRKKGGEYPSALLNTAEAAAFLGIPKSTLESWRVGRGQGGPPYFKVHAHAVRYKLSDLERWLGKCRVEARGKGRRAGR
jgi:hypothetical protein